MSESASTQAQLAAARPGAGVRWSSFIGVWTSSAGRRVTPFPRARPWTPVQKHPGIVASVDLVIAPGGPHCSGQYGSAWMFGGTLQNLWFRRTTSVPCNNTRQVRPSWLGDTPTPGRRAADSPGPSRSQTRPSAEGAGRPRGGVPARAAAAGNVGYERSGARAPGRPSAGLKLCWERGGVVSVGGGACQGAPRCWRRPATRNCTKSGKHNLW